MTLVELLTGANLVLKLIQARLVLLITLCLTAGMFGWAMAKETWLSAIIAAAWGAMIFWPVVFTERHRSAPRDEVQSTQRQESPPDSDHQRARSRESIAA